ncbi:MAG: FHA domain-containing protein [Candidatus Thiodiazotropha sp.]
MFRYISKSVVVFLLLVLAVSARSAAAAVDVVVLMDASSVTDQQNRAVIKSVFDRLSTKLDEDSRFGLFTYNDTAIEVVPLKQLDGTILSMLSTGNDGSALNDQIKNPVAALEKVIYSLRGKEREGAQKVILILGNGEIKTGNLLRDRELSNWLLEDLAGEMKRSEIQLYWLAFNETADFRIIQSVTRKTNGAYYRAFSIKDAVPSIDAMLSEMAGTGNTVSRSVDERFGGFTSIFDGSSLTSQNSNSIFGLGLVAFILLLGTSIAASLGIILLRKSKAQRSEISRVSIDHDYSHAVLRDVAGFTALKEYDITDKKTYIGRLPREVTERSTVVVIRDGTVGREHATIVERDGTYWLRDNGTVNGTYLNNQKLNAEARLHDGDKIRFARFEFEIELPREEVTQGLGDRVDDNARKSIRVVEEDYYEDQDKTVYRNQ